MCFGAKELPKLLPKGGDQSWVSVVNKVTWHTKATHYMLQEKAGNSCCRQLVVTHSTWNEHSKFCQPVTNCHDCIVPLAGGKFYNKVQRPR